MRLEIPPVGFDADDIKPVKDLGSGSGRSSCLRMLIWLYFFLVMMVLRTLSSFQITLSYI